MEEGVRGGWDGGWRRRRGLEEEVRGKGRIVMGERKGRRGEGDG